MLRLLLGMFLGGGRHYRGNRRQSGFGSSLKTRLFLALLLFGFAFFSYKFSTRKEKNPVTGEVQQVGMTVKDEIALGLQASKHMEKQHMGKVSENSELTQLVKTIGNKLVSYNKLEKISQYPFEFSLLADRNTVNAFALPGGKTYITYALLTKFDKNNLADQLAGVMGHEIAHVIARHSAEQAAKSKLSSGIAGAIGVLVDSGGRGGNRQLASLVNHVLNTKYSRSDELESDKLGMVFMFKAGFDPTQMARVMEILHESSGGKQTAEFMSTHPSTKNRISQISRIAKILSNANRNSSLQELLREVGY